MLRSSVTSPELSGVGKWSAAARALTVVPVDQRGECGRLRDRHDRFERQRGAVGIVAVRDAADRVAQDFDRRLGQVLVVVCRTCFPKVLEFPRLLHPGFDVRPRLDAGQCAQFLEACVRARSPAQKNGGFRIGVLWQDALEMRMNDTIHRPVKRLSCLHAAIEQLPPFGPLLEFPIR